MENDTSDAKDPETGGPLPESAAAPPETPRFAVSLTIEIEQVLVPIERLQGLREGALIPVEAEEGVIPVRILANGRAIARGNLVSVGESYGVLIDEDPLGI